MKHYYEYRIKNNDTLSGIIYTMFGISPSSPEYRLAVEHIKQLNPALANPNQIFAGAILRLGEIKEHTAEPSPQPIVIPVPTPPAPPHRPITSTVAQHELENFWLLSWLEHSNKLVIPGSIVMGAGENLLSPGNTGLISKVGDLYADYKAGKMTKNQYNYQRRKLLFQLQRNIGPIEKLLFGNKTTLESVRIARGGGVPATAHIEKHTSRLAGLARHAKYGGVALTVVGAGAACAQIANTDDANKKNEILVETLSSTIISGGIGLVVGVFLISNPIGWGAAIVIAAGSTALSYGSGKAGTYLYDKYGNKMDIATGMGVNKLCQR